MLKFHHLVFDSIKMILRRASRWLLLGSDRWVDIQMMENESQIPPKAS